MDLLDGRAHVRDYSLERLMMLTDGVYAIALTLLALELRPPPGWDHTVAGLWRGAAPSFAAYALSFFSLSTFWASQRQFSGRFVRSDFLLSGLALVTLGFITLIPVSTRIYAEAIGAVGGSAGVSGLYLANVAAVALGNALSWAWAARAGLLDAAVGPWSRGAVFAILLLSPVVMTALGVFAWAPGLHWAPVLIWPVGVLVGLLRRWALRRDAARAAAALT